MNEFYMKLPRNKKEALFYLIIVSIISVNIIAPVVVLLETGFDLQHYQQTLRVIPLLWLAVITINLIVRKPASNLKQRIIKSSDSFNAQIITNVMCNVYFSSYDNSWNVDWSLAIIVDPT